MNYESITYPDVNNGLGCRVTLWISGCIHHCEGCHNKSTWDFSSGRIFDKEAMDKLIDLLSLPYIKGLTLSGGDPLCSYDEILELVRYVKDKLPSKDIWLYTGFTMEHIKSNMKDILHYVDYVVDGVFLKDKRDVTLAFRGSSNQRIWERAENGEFIISALN